MRSETVSDQSVEPTIRRLYQLDEEPQSNSDLETFSKVDRVLKRLDQIEH